MMLQPVTILLIEEHDEYASILKSACTNTSDRKTTCTLVSVATIETALTYIAEHGNVDIVLLSMIAQGNIGMDDLHTLYGDHPDIPVIVLLDKQCNNPYQVVESGAQGYFLHEQLSTQAFIHALCCTIERNTMYRQIEQYNEELQHRELRFQNLINKNADGIVVVDKQGYIRFVNPAAEVLFGKAATMLVGEQFGFPVVTGSAEIDVLHKGEDTPSIAEMRVVETVWEGDSVYLTSLRDITEHRQLQESLRESEQLNRSILNSIDAHIVVINQQGHVVTANNSWPHFSQQDQHILPEDVTQGGDYLEACCTVFGRHSRFVTGLKAVLYGDSESLDIEYKMGTNDKTAHWFHIRVMPLEGSRKQNRQVVISYNDITEHKRATLAQADAKANEARIREQEREIRGLLQLTNNTSPTTITASAFGLLPLRDSAPTVFEELVRRYADLMELSMEQRAFKVEYDLSDGLRSMAERLGFLRAGPRDVVEIHSTVLQEKSRGVNPVKAQAYVEEGRLLVLELMGYLVLYYRNYSLGKQKVLTPKPSA